MGTTSREVFTAMSFSEEWHLKITHFFTLFFVICDFQKNKTEYELFNYYTNKFYVSVFDEIWRKCYMSIM